MMWPQLQTIAQITIGRVLNSLPEGLLIALFAGAMLRLLPRQNSGTRFAVWFVALLTVAVLPLAGLPLVGHLDGGHFVLAGSGRPLVTVSGSWGLILFGAWVFASGTAVLRLAAGLLRLHALRKSCVAVDELELAPEVRKTLADFTSSREVSLHTSERVRVPAAIGFFKPMIVIPSWALRELKPSDLNVVLLHEFAHLRRGDAWTNLFQKMVRALFLFHPAVWWIESRLSLEREMACDDQVLAEVPDARSYATCLIALLEKSVARRDWAMAQAVVHRAHEASLRLAQILDVTRPRSKHVWKPALGFVGVFSVLCLVTSANVPQFVAFESSAQIASEKVHPALLGGPQLHAAKVIPVGLHTGSSSRLKPPQQHAAEAVRDLSPHRNPAAQSIPAHLSAGTEQSQVHAASANGDQNLMRSETLLIIRTTQQVGPNSWVWSVGVWRMKLVNPTQPAIEKGTVAKKT